jgi:hypothetical protein
MKKTLIVRVGEGLGNQLFMYANAYALAKKNNYTLLIDSESSYFKKKNRSRGRKYNLDFFNLSEALCPENLMFNSYIKDLERKFFKFIDIFKAQKKFISETEIVKNTQFNKIILSEQNSPLYIEGHYESLLYFLDFEKDLKKKLKIKHELLDLSNPLINKIKNLNSVSIHLRKNRFNDDVNNTNFNNDFKSNKFEIDTIKYVEKSIIFLDKKLNNPHYFIWSNDIIKSKKDFVNSDKFTFIENNTTAMDFHLFSLCKHFIVGPSTFHWWGAWLNENDNKICLRPSNINPSNNKDFWPKDWIVI